MRLIDADKLKDRIQNGYVCLVPDPDTDKIIQMIENSIIKVIDEASTVTSDKLEDTPKHEMISYVNKEQAKRLIYDRINELNKLNNDDYITGFIVAYQNVMNMLNALPTVELDVEEELGVLKDMPDGEAYYRNGYCTKCKAQMPTEVLHGKISQRSIKFCFNCGAKINGVLWTLIEEGIIKEK